MSEFRNRETWLTDLGEHVAAIIADKTGLDCGKWRVTCGFPSKKPLKGGKSGTSLGECWTPASSDDAHSEIMISPIDDDRQSVAETLAHELLHAALPGEGHGKTFQRAAKLIGFTKPYTMTPATDDLHAWLKPLLATMPPYPHAKLNASKRAEGEKKPQKNRYIKAECGTCDYIVRVARKWLDVAGAPHCPAHGEMQVEDVNDSENEG